VCFAPSRFTGKERDTESGNDYFGARYYGSSMGRFMSPDWSAQEEPVPYAKLDNPQSLNLYAYVGNNPLGGVDADGHDSFHLCTGAEQGAGNCVMGDVSTEQGDQQAAQQTNLTAEIRNIPKLDLSQWNSPTGGADRGCDSGGCGYFGAHRAEGLGTTHHGTDYLGTVGQDVVAIHSGTVSGIGFAYKGDTNLRSIDLKTTNGFTFQELYVQPLASIRSGVFVNRGQVIGAMQDVQEHVGTNVPPHVHVGIRYNGSMVNPSLFIQPQLFAPLP
jgi:RHS repeat-associated protein